LKKDLLADLRRGKHLNTREMLYLTMTLALPSIIAEVSYLFMSFIDASMVGSLGANASASVGIVATTTWLLGGIIRSATLGFTVQVAHLYGAEDYKNAYCTGWNHRL
jgi:Na+-driven multidrug efflux pump